MGALGCSREPRELGTFGNTPCPTGLALTTGPRHSLVPFQEISEGSPGSPQPASTQVG